MAKWSRLGVAFLHPDFERPVFGSVLYILLQKCKYMYLFYKTKYTVKHCRFVLISVDKSFVKNDPLLKHLKN